MNENMHSLMRAGNSAMPTTLEYCQHYMGAIETQLMTIFPEVGFIVKTSHRASGSAGLDLFMAGGDLHEITSILNKKDYNEFGPSVFLSALSRI